MKHSVFENAQHATNAYCALHPNHELSFFGLGIAMTLFCVLLSFPVRKMFVA